MKKILTFLFCLFTVSVFGQLKRNVFHVVDSQSKKPVAYTSVVIVRAKLSITTEKDGVFTIPGNLSLMRDSVIIYAQNYEAFNTTLAQLSGVDTIKLNKMADRAIATRISYNADTLLNNFNKNDIIYYAGLQTETTNFEFLQIAQRFDIPLTGVRLKNVAIERLSFNLVYDLKDPDSQYGYTELEHTRYRIRIYDLDARTGGPGNDLCEKVIETSSSDSKQASINLKSYNIIVPGKTFFVAVEWLRDFYNVGHTMVYDKKLKREVKHDNYRPAIGISPIYGKKLNIWALNFKHDWKPFNYFMPFGTDLAIKASVEY